MIVQNTKEQFTEAQQEIISNFLDQTDATKIIYNPGTTMVTSYPGDGSEIEQTITGAGETFSFSRTFYIDSDAKASKIQLSIDNNLNVTVSYWISLRGLKREQAKDIGVLERDLSDIYDRAAERRDVVQGYAEISVECFKNYNPGVNYTELINTVEVLKNLGLTIRPEILPNLDMKGKQL